MNIKITEEKKTFIRMLLYLMVPKKVIAKMLDVNEVTIGKHSKLTKAEMNDMGPQPEGQELRLEVFKMYVWSQTDILEMSMVFGVSIAEIESIQKAIFDYLKMQRCVSYCEGIITSVFLYQKIQFESTISVEEKKLVEKLFEHQTYESIYLKEKKPGKKLFFDCCMRIHKEQELLMPTKYNIYRPEECLTKVIDSFVNEERSKVGVYISKRFVDFIKSFFATLSKKEQASLYSLAELPEFVEAFTEYKNLKPNAIQSKRKTALILLRGRIKHYLKLGETIIPEGKKHLDDILHHLELVQKKESELLNLKKDFEKFQLTAIRLAKFSAENMPIEKVDDTIVASIQKVDPELLKLIKTIEPVQLVPVGVEVIQSEQMKFYLTNIMDMDLSVRLYTCLSYAEIEYGWQILTISKHDFLKFRNFGKKSMIELEELIHNKKLVFNSIDPSLQRYLEDKIIKKK
ncbi:MAG: hypothetical protein NT068_03495 [Candidatus Nomurabacteria bacterium]|nr:hypothetical protein [Candidatus Nomurabacteria bacterium]